MFKIIMASLFIMIKPKPRVYVCESCGWRKVISPISDVLMPGDYYDSCSACNAKSLKLKKFNPGVEVGFRLLSKIFKH